MSELLDDLRETLSGGPWDEDAMARFEAACTAVRDVASLRAGLEEVLRRDGAPSAEDFLSRADGWLLTLAQASGPRERAAWHTLRARLSARAAAPDGDSTLMAWKAAFEAAPSRALLDRLDGWTDGGLRREPLEGPALTAKAQLGSVTQRRAAVRRLALRELGLDDRSGEVTKALTKAASKRLAALAPEGTDLVELLASPPGALALPLDVAPPREDPASMWTRMGQALLEEGEEHEAEDALLRAVGEGRSPEAELALEALLRDDGRYDELRQLLEGWLESATGVWRVALTRRLVALVADDLGDPDGAAALLDLPRVGPDEATSEALLAAAGALEAGDAAGAVAGLEAASKSAQGETLVALLVAKARAEEAGLRDEQAAERTWRRVRIAAPRHPEAWLFQRRANARRDDPRRLHADLAQLHTALVGDALRGERVDVALAMGRLAEGPLDAADKAVDGWRRVLADMPAHSGANEALVRLHTAAGRWHALADHLEAWFAALPDHAVERKTGLLFELIRIHQDPARLPMEELVVATYRRIVALAPDNRRALDQLARRHQDGQRWRELLAVLEQRVAHTDDPVELIGLFGQIAELTLERTRSPMQAVPLLERILELDPGNLEVVQRLRELFGRQVDTERLYKTYQRELALLEGADRMDVLVELARLATDPLFRHEEAVAWWREVLALDATHAEALAALGTLHAEQDDWGGYVALLEGRLAEASTKKQKVEALLELGEVAYARLGDEDRARRHFQAILELSPFNAPARRFLQRLYVTRRAWEELRSLFAPSEDWAGYVALLREVAEADSAGDAALAADAWREIARAAVGLLDDAALHRDALVGALGVDPTAVDVARELRDLEADDSVALTALADHAEGAERVEALVALAVAAEEADDPSAAFAHYAAAVVEQAREGALEHVAALERVTAPSERWEDEARALSEALATLPTDSDAARVALHRALGHRLRGPLGDTEGAVTHYRHVLQLSPGDADALSNLEELHLSRTDFEGLEDVLRQRVEAVDAAEGDPELALQTLHRLAQLYEDVFLDPDRAAAAWLEVLDRSPRDEEALAGLRNVLSAEEQWGELAGALEAALSRSDGPAERAELALELAQLHREHLDDPETAADHLAEVMSRPEGDHDAGATLLEAMFAAAEARPAVAVLLETRYRETGDATALVPVLEARLEHAGTRDERLALLDEIGELADGPLASPSLAYRIRSERFRWHPSDRTTWAMLSALAKETGLVRDLAALWEAAIEGAAADDGGPEVALEGEDDPPALRRALADLLEHAGALDEAIVQHERVLELAGAVAEAPEAADALERLYTATGRDAQLATLELALAASGLSGVDARAKTLSAADRLAGPLARMDEAADALEAWLAESPDDQVVADKAIGMWSQLGRWQALADHLERHATALMGDEPARWAATRDAWARIQQTRLGELGRALDAWLEILGEALVPMPLREAARDALMTTASSDDVTKGDRSRVLEALEAWYAALDDPDGEVEVRLLRAVDTPAGAARAALYIEAAELLVARAGAGQGDAAVERSMRLFGRALQTHPESAEALAGLEATAERVGGGEALRPLADALAIAAAAAPSPTVRAELLAREAKVAEEALGEPARAVAAWEPIAASGSGAPIERVMEAVEALDRLHLESGDVEARLPIIRRRGEVAKKPAAKLEWLRVEAELLESLGQADQAVAVLRRVLRETRATAREDLLAAREAAIASLVALLSSSGRHEELIGWLVELSDEARDGDRAMSLIERAAAVAEQGLDDLGQAIGLWERVLDRQGDHPDAVAALDRLYTAAQRWKDKAALLERRIAQCRTGGDAMGEQVGLFTLAQLQENRLEVPGEALATYLVLLDRAPDFPPLRAALRALSLVDEVAAGARAALVRALRQADFALEGVADELAGVLRAQLGAGDEGLDRAAAEAELAALYLDALGRPEEAFERGAGAYRAGPDGADGEARRELLVRAATAAGTLPDLPGVLRAVSGRIGELEARQARRRDDVALLDRLGFDHDTLAPFWEDVLSDAPSDDEALAALADGARDAGDVERLVDLLARRAPLAADDDALVAIRRERARALTGLATRRTDAVQAWRAVLEAAPTDGEASREAARLLAQAGDTEGLVAVLEARLDALGGDTASSAEARPVRMSLAEIAWREQHEPAKALSHYRAVLERDAAADGSEAGAPASDVVEALEAMWGEGLERAALLPRLESAYEAVEDWSKLVALYRSTLEGEETADLDRELRLECLAKVARIQRQHLGQTEPAWATLKDLVERASDPTPHLEELEQLTEDLGRWEQLLSLYEGLVFAGQAEPSLIARLARLIDLRRGDISAASGYYRLALERNPADRTTREALAELLTRSERWEELAQHRLRSAELLESKQARVRSLLAAAGVFRDRLETPEAAIEALQRVVKLEPTHAAARTEAIRLLGVVGRDQERQAALTLWAEELEADDPDSPQALGLRTQLAESLLNAPETWAQGVDEALAVQARAAKSGGGAVASQPEAMAVLGAAIAHLAADGEPPAGAVDGWAEATLRALDALDAAPEEHSGAVPMEAVRLRARLTATTDATARAELQDRLAEAAEAAGDTEEALVARLGSLSDAPEREGAADRAELAARDLGAPGWERLRLQLAALLPRLADTEHEADATARLARVLSERLDALDQALPHYERLLELRPDAQEAHSALVAWAERLEDDEAQALALQRWADTIREDARRRELRARAGALWMDALDRPEEAAAVLERELPVAVAHAEVGGRLEKLYGRLRRFDALSALYTQLLDTDELDADARVETLAKQAQVAETQLGDADAARAAIDALLVLDPAHLFGLRTRARLAEARADWAVADAALAALVESAPTPAAKARLASERARVAQARDDLSPREAAAIIVASASVALDAEHHQDGAAFVPQTEARLAWVAGLSDASPGDRVRAAAALAERWEAAGRDDEAAAVLGVAEDAVADDQRVAWGARRAELLARGGADPEAVWGALRQLAASRPDDPLAWERLASFADTHDAWPRALDTAEEVLDAATGEAAVVVARWLGDKARLIDGDKERAVAAYAAVRAAVPDDVDAADALEALYEELGRHEALEALVVERAATLPPGERAERISALARSIVARQGRAAAVPLWRRVLQAVPDHGATLDELERLASSDEATDEADALLEQQLEAAGQDARLAEVWAVRARRMADPEAAAALMAKAAARRAALSETADGRLVAWLEALDFGVGDAALVDAAEKAAARVRTPSGWTRLLASLERFAPQAASAEGRAAAWRAVARTRRDALNDPAGALAALERVLVDTPEAPDVLAEARRLYADAEDLAKLTEATRALVVALDGPEARSEAWREVAAVAGSVGDDDTRLQALESAWREGGAPEVVEELLAAYESQERFGRLTSVLAEMAGQEADPGRAARQYQRLGLLLRDELNDVDGAVDAFGKALDRNPTLEVAAQALEQHYRDAEQWDRLAALLQTRVDLAESAASTVPWLMEQAWIAERQLGDLDTAMRAYETVLRLEPRHERALDELIALCSSAGESTKLPGLLERKASQVSAKSERMALLARAAELRLEPLNEPLAAERLAREVLDEDGEHPRALRVMGRLKAARGDVEGAVKMFEALLGQTPGSEHAAALVDLGVLYQEHLNRPRDAMRAFLEARELAPEAPDVHERLRGLLEETGSWDDLRMLLVEEYAVSVEPTEQCAKALELAKLHLHHIEAGRDKLVVEWLDKAHEARRDHPEVAEVYVDYFVSRGDWAQAAPRLEWLVSYLEGKKLTQQLPHRAHQLGGILERLERPTDALSYYKLAMQVDGRHIQNLLDYGRLLVEREQWDRALRVHQNLLMQAKELPDADSHDAVLYRLAQSCAELESGPKAKQYLAKLLKRRPDHPEGLALRARLGG